MFYNHPQHDGVSISGNTVTADLNRLPADVATIAVVVSVDLSSREPFSPRHHT
ncbi:hypothetical protein ABZ741_39375 [Streptomyces globisporus]|uniref:hypothetical protein n=1 Tax=Streptomyces globisporus TaxID=1908 RepID=UPI000B317384